MTLKYTTTEELAQIMGLVAKVPSWAISGTPENEEVGTGNDSKTIFYLDRQNIINDSHTFYYGADATATDLLIETTDYTLDLDSGKIILTEAGVTKLSTSKIYAAYSYISNEMSDSYLTRVLERAETEVDLSVNSKFTDGTSTNPSYPVNTEIQPSPGYFRDQIIIEKKPMKDIVSALDGDMTIDQNTLDVTASDGATFPSSGYVVVGTEVMSYTGITTDQLTGVTRGALGTTATTHTDLDAVHTTILFLSNTPEGTAVTWTVQEWDSKMHANSEGLFYSFNSTYSSFNSADKLTRQDVANRVKAIYYYGYDTIPTDITRLALLFAKRQLIQDNIGKSMIAGRNEFQPEMFNVDIREIDLIVNDYIVLPMGNT